jgi:hypothetical protein
MLVDTASSPISNEIMDIAIITMITMLANHIPSINTQLVQCNKFEFLLEIDIKNVVPLL